MIKWIFAGLLVANVAVALWFFGATEGEGAPETTARTEVNPQKMKLVGEPGVKLKLRPKPAEVAVDAAQTEAAPRVCFRAGPFDELDQALTAGRKLEEKQITFMRREDSRQSVTGYRVYLPPFASRQAAEAKRKELFKLGFRDNALLLQDGRYAISLGLYSVETNARNHVKNLAAKGIKAKLDPIQKMHPIFWLELSGDGLADVLKEFEWGVSSVTLAEYPCPAPEAPAPTEAAPKAETEEP
jgi:hypothetical protein